MNSLQKLFLALFTFAVCTPAYAWDKIINFPGWHEIDVKQTIRPPYVEVLIDEQFAPHSNFFINEFNIFRCDVVEYHKFGFQYRMIVRWHNYQKTGQCELNWDTQNYFHVNFTIKKTK